MTVIQILVWEGQHDFAKRLERCLNREDGPEILRYDEEAEHPSSDAPMEADIAFISTSALRRYDRNHLAWERIKGIPVIWVGSGDQSVYTTTALSERVVLPAYFNCASLETVMRHTLRSTPRFGVDTHPGSEAETEKGHIELPLRKEGSFLYQAACMQQLVANARLYGALSVSVLIRGGSGTGKEHIARMVADAHPDYRNGHFVAVNCAAIPDTLFESLFFGHVKGSFTGAVRDHAGYFRDAHNGTLYLDEIGDLPFYQQVKLLRALDDGVIHPVGSSETIKTNFRLVTATNRPLNRMIQEGTFRLDFYHRIAVVELYVPTLHERGADEKLLLFSAAMRQSLNHYAQEVCDLPELPLWLKDWVSSYPFSGNVRELFNKAARMAAYYLGHHRFEQAECMHLLCTDALECETPETDELPDFTSKTEERNQVLQALEKNQWRRSETADALGWSRKTLWLKMKKYGLSD
ncbi:sigma 54-interacting transcriptional regulator [Acidithiobacillus montserratensis]|uniref:Sigma 54-interacting transcriptional regulator n=1 Tax=Acidithiobacillus montserratensis TaxID=2729135 RepID=A0ACD5HHC4_9PROT|nr:sigma 54-interacting transcriptional regulator [Acidithiobacillus montserratensis]MBU2748887.1 sigma-54-dependent Fis family transcriptional regulator [Acidithiobacillus montserratensis]